MILYLPEIIEFKFINYYVADFKSNFDNSRIIQYMQNNKFIPLKTGILLPINQNRLFLNFSEEIERELPKKRLEIELNSFGVSSFLNKLEQSQFSSKNKIKKLKEQLFGPNIFNLSHFTFISSYYNSSTPIPIYLSANSQMYFLDIAKNNPIQQTNSLSKRIAQILKIYNSPSYPTIPHKTKKVICKGGSNVIQFPRK